MRPQISRIALFTYLRWIIATICGALGLICIGLVPYIAWHESLFFPGIQLPLWWLLPAFYCLMIPIFIGIYQTFAICGEGLTFKEYQESTALRLLVISRCALADIVLLIILGIALLITQLLYPWLFILLVVLLFAAALVAVMAAVLAALVRKKIEEKETPHVDTN